uniref:Uncharacterized protein n=1 Tax=Acrobeloides nanus TaxID=290746 RepID=A0A914EDS9_9BILA
MFSVAQKLMSQAGDIPSAIQDSFAGKSDGIRKIVSSALGGGLISQLIENPIKAAGNMGFNLEQYGLNGTMLENAFKLPNHVPNLGNMNLLNNSIQGGELLFNSGLMGFNNPFSTSTPSTTPTETTPEVVYVDGRPLLRPEILSDIIGGQHEGENSNSPGNRFPDFPSYRREHEAPYMILPPGGQHGLPPQPPYLHQRGPNHIHRMYEYQHTTPSTTTTTTTVPPTTTNPMANLISIANSLGFFSPKEVSTPPPQVVVVEKYATPPPPPSPL